MFVALFVASFALALALSITVAWISREAIDSILRRFVTDFAVRTGFEKYIRFAIVVVGISGGTRVRVLQEFLAASDLNKAAMAAQLTQEFWVMEIYRTILGTLEGIATLLLVCIFLALIAPVVVRMLKLEPAKTNEGQQTSGGSERPVPTKS
jgi:hypothetical protein